MTKQRRTFSPEFKREAADLVLKQNYTSSTTLLDGKRTRQAPAEPKEREIEKAYETVRKSALARTAELTHLSQKLLTALITRPSNEQIAISVANILGVWYLHNLPHQRSDLPTL